MDVLSAGLVVGAFAFNEDGMRIIGHDPSFIEWQEAGVVLRGIERRVQFWVGDWINYGRNRWGAEAEQGIASDAEILASEATGWTPETVETYARVARQVDPVNRDPDLPFSHHRIVADRPPAEQRTWLARSKAENWSVAKLRGEVRKATDPHAERICWLVVSCRDEDDREALRVRLAQEGREVKLP